MRNILGKGIVFSSSETKLHARMLLTSSSDTDVCFALLHCIFQAHNTIHYINYVLYTKENVLFFAENIIL